MSIATLARKSRTQRGAGTRTGWTLATTKSGNCPGPCGGGAPAKQQSFRRLMKNKARPGVEQEATASCCAGRTQRVRGGWRPSEDVVTSAVGLVFTQGEVVGTLIEVVWEEDDVPGQGYGIFQMADCESVFVLGPPDIVHNAGDLGAPSLRPTVLSPPMDTYAPCDCCPPVATWKKTNNPKGNQSIGYYLWRKKQLTHNCIKHCIPHREHYNATCTRTQRVEGHWSSLEGTIGHVFTQQQQQPNVLIFGTLLETGTHYAIFQMADCNSAFAKFEPGKSALVLSTDEQASFYIDTAHQPISTIVPAHDTGYCHGPCDNVGCKCNCNKSMGGTACCVVHKTMLPLSNSENIAWVVEDRTCLQTSKHDPRNPNTC